MIHYFELGNETLLVLFHGTGGDEKDLVHLAKEICPHASILSLRGNIVENGMNRFFKRTAMNVFDKENVLLEAEKIQQFLVRKIPTITQQQKISNIIFLGYSNGANMIGVLLQLYPELVQKAILLHPMQVIEESQKISAKIILTSGKNDQMIPEKETQIFEKFLQAKGAQTTHLTFEGGHEISFAEIDSIKEQIAYLK